jgi:hypothetical protein
LTLAAVAGHCVTGGRTDLGVQNFRPSPIEKMIPQSVGFSLNGTHLALAKPHVTHSKSRNRPCEWVYKSQHLFILNNLADRVGFEFTRKGSFNNIESTAIGSMGDMR